MSDLAIEINGLSKMYRVGEAAPHEDIRELVMSVVKWPARAIKALTAPRSDTATRDSNEFWAIDDVSFNVHRGEVVGVVGRNGAGKSTLLKLLSRITDPTRGEALIHGRVGSLLEVGTGFHPDLTGRENVFLNGAILGMRTAEVKAKFDEIVAFAELQKFIDTPVKRYSSGMYVRLAFAVAAHLEPEILIVDEVLAVGDASFQSRCLKKMRDVASHGRTVLFVSHNMAAVQSLCTRAVWLDRGQVRSNGEVGKVVDEYLADMFIGTDAHVALKDLERPSHMKVTPARIHRITFNNGEDPRHGEPLEIRLEFETDRPLDGVVFSVALTTTEGVRLLSMDTDVGGPRFKLEQSGRGEAVIKLPCLELQPGEYAVDLGIRSGENTMLDLLLGCARVPIRPGPSTPNVIIGRSVSGGVRPRTTTTIKSDPDKPLDASPETYESH